MEGYWADRAGNIYGPFSVQEDGFPNAGEVVRWYREQREMSRAELAALLGDQERWIRKMENQNTVSELLSRRRLIAEVLEIPPVLLGLSVLGEESFLKRAAPGVLPSKTVIPGKADFKLLKHEYKKCWSGYYTKGAKTVLPEVNHQIQYIELLLAQGGLGSRRADLLTQLCGFDQLRSSLAKQLKISTPSTNRMVDIALELQDPELIAIALDRRSGWYDYAGDPTSALRDMQLALTFIEQARKPVQGDVLSRTGMLLAQTAQDKGDVKNALKLLDRSHDGLDYHSSEDSYHTKFGEGLLWVYRSEALIYGSRVDPDLINAAFQSLDEANKMTPKSLISRKLIIDALYSQAALASDDPLVAASTALTTLKRAKSLSDMRVMARIQRLHEALQASYKSMAEVKELGYQLHLIQKSI